MRPLCINDDWGFDEPFEERLDIVRKAGFDGVFTGWEAGNDVRRISSQIHDAGLNYQSIHAPFGGVDSVWTDGAAGDAFIDMLMRCMYDCAENGIPLMISHVMIGFDKHSPTPIGTERFGRLCAAADDAGVMIGFENTEGEEYLARVMCELSGFKSCRFCWDTGHEMCYNGSKDMLALYGDRLVGTHLNDNLGITGLVRDIALTWHDDAHMLPFDGCGDWDGIARRLCAHGYDGPLTFELTREGKPGRHTHDAYSGWSCTEFAENAYRRARQFAELVEAAEG